MSSEKGLLSESSGNRGKLWARRQSKKHSKGGGALTPEREGRKIRGQRYLNWVTAQKNKEDDGEE